MTSYCRAPLTYTAHQRSIVGDTKMSVINNDHLGWLKCDGRTLNVNDYYILWRVVLYSFGSNAGDSNTFKLPNAAGRVPGVVGTGTDINTSTFTLLLGATPGEYEHTLIINEIPAHTHGSNDVSGNTNGNGNTTTNGLHTHPIIDPGHAHSISTANAGATVEGRVGQAVDNVAEGPAFTNSNVTSITMSNAGDHFHSMCNTGGSGSHNNVQPMIGLGNMFIFCGKYMYPSDATTPFAGYPYLSNSQIL
jgi:microcystin-dependent protein